VAALWPWLAIAGLGALHGLSPASGWMLAAACGVQSRDPAQARRALGPIACGQVAAMGALAWGISHGLSIDRALMRDLAIALLLVAALWFGVRRRSPPIRVGARARSAGLALGSFLMASPQGAGLKLVPALAPLCAGAGANRFAGSSLAVAVAAMAVHTTAMLLVAGLLGTVACRGLRRIVYRMRVVAATD
jgi:hypothetical protein